MHPRHSHFLEKAEADTRAAEIAANFEAEREQRQAIFREQAAQEAQKAHRAASVKAAIQQGGITLGMTGDECIRASGKPQIVKRTTAETCPRRTRIMRKF